MLAATSVGLSWPGLKDGRFFDNDHNTRIAYNLAKHGVFHEISSWNPRKGPYMRREPGYPVFIALALATVPSFPETPYRCVLNPLCAPGEPLRKRLRQAELAVVAAAVGATFLAALALARNWPLALAAGTAALFLIQNNISGNALAGILLLTHAVLAWRAWRRPRAATGALAGLALGLAVLTDAILQYWLVVLAALCAAGLWREAGRRRPLAGAVAAMLLAASLPAGLWMARNHAVAGQFEVSDRAGEVLAIRAEHAQATWPEIRGMLAFHLPTKHVWYGSVLKRLAMDRLRPETFGYARIRDALVSVGGENLAGFYPRALLALRPDPVKGSHSAVAKRADLLAPGWRQGTAHERDLVFRRAALQLIRENWSKHLAVSLPMALRGMDHRCRGYAFPGASRVMVEMNKGMCMASKALSFAFIPAALAMLVLAARRRDMALALLVLPALYFFAIHALATHFIPRYAQPILPLLMVVAALAASEFLRWRAARTREPRAWTHASTRRPAEGRMETGRMPGTGGGARSPRTLT